VALTAAELVERFYHVVWNKAALEGFTCQIEEVIAAGDNAAARMTFYGRHRGRFFGIEPSGRKAGAAQHFSKPATEKSSSCGCW
jgi:predicted ester cyclase